MRPFYGAKFINKKWIDSGRVLLERGEIPKALKQKESRGRINLRDIYIIRFRRSRCLPLFKEHEAHLRG